MTTRPPLIPVEQVETVARAIYALNPAVWARQLSGPERRDWNDVACYNPPEVRLAREQAHAALTALEPHLEASRLQARREALEEAAKVAEVDCRTTGTDWDSELHNGACDAIAEHIRRTLRGES